ncbi:MAG TPA: hypothetical protein VGL86_08830 [Polyangia bacterium]
MSVAIHGISVGPTAPSGLIDARAWNWKFPGTVVVLVSVVPAVMLGVPVDVVGLAEELHAAIAAGPEVVGRRCPADEHQLLRAEIFVPRQKRPKLSRAQPEELPRTEVHVAVEQERWELTELEAAPIFDPRPQERAVDARPHVRQWEVRPVVGAAFGEARLPLKRHLQADPQLPVAVGGLDAEAFALEPGRRRRRRLRLVRAGARGCREKRRSHDERVPSCEHGTASGCGGVRNCTGGTIKAAIAISRVRDTSRRRR